MEKDTTETHSRRVRTAMIIELTCSDGIKKKLRADLAAAGVTRLIMGESQSIPEALDRCIIRGTRSRDCETDLSSPPIKLQQCTKIEAGSDQWVSPCSNEMARWPLATGLDSNSSLYVDRKFVLSTNHHGAVDVPFDLEYIKHSIMFTYGYSL
jgi:hypothetical protein